MTFDGQMIKPKTIQKRIKFRKQKKEKSEECWYASIS